MFVQGEEIHRIVGMNKLTKEEFPQERSKRLHSILDRIQDGLETSLQNVKSLTSESRSEDKHEARGGNVETRQREDQIRDKINRAVRDQMGSKMDRRKARSNGSSAAKHPKRNTTRDARSASHFLASPVRGRNNHGETTISEGTSRRMTTESINSRDSSKSRFSLSSSSASSLGESLGSGNTSSEMISRMEVSLQSSRPDTQVSSRSHTMASSNKRAHASSPSLSLSTSDSETDGGSVETTETSESSGSESDSLISRVSSYSSRRFGRSKKQVPHRGRSRSKRTSIRTRPQHNRTRRRGKLTLRKILSCMISNLTIEQHSLCRTRVAAVCTGK